MKTVTTLSIPLLLLLVTGCPEQGSGYGYDWEYPVTVTAEGNGFLLVEPDAALFSVTVSSVSSNLEDSESESASMLEDVSDICTAEGMAVTPSYTDVQVSPSWSDYSYDFTGPDMYTVTKVLTVAADSEDVFNGLVPYLLSAGAVSIVPEGFVCTSTEMNESALLEIAFNDAHERGEVLASRAEASLGELLQIGASGIIGEGEVFQSREECFLSVSLEVTWALASIEGEGN